jgi:hypothetical protein
MGTYAGNNAAWIDNIYQFDETDVVQGGPNGIDNLPLKNLADRTAFLKAQIGLVDRLSGDVVINANAAITAANHSGKLISAVANGVITLTLDDVTTFKAGTIIPISSFCAVNSVVYVFASAGQKFYDSGAGRSAMYMHNKEHLFLVASATGWKILNAIGNFYSAGEEFHCRKIVNNTLTLVGAVISRTIYPRLFEYVQSLPAECIVTEAVWLSDPLRYRGFYTLGDGNTNFRIPDERGLSERTLDQGRGIDYLRMDEKPGGYEKDGVGKHTHEVPIPKDKTSQSQDGQGRRCNKLNCYRRRVTKRNNHKKHW